jgi:Serine dehydrogenase proteinase
MTVSNNGPIPGTDGPNGGIGLTDTGSFYYREIDAGQQEKIREAGRTFGALTGGAPCLLLMGQLIGVGDPDKATERRVQHACETRFGYPKAEPEQKADVINVILDSTGGPLDSAFRTALYLSRYAKKIRVYVPRRAKSASTLIAVGANEIIMSPFSELGPLDTQIRDPRNPTDYISALDCYQSVDYVREFGFSTLSQALKQLAAVTQGKLLLSDSLNASAQFAIGSITPMLSQTRSLDFGAWGRSLKMGERYAQILITRAAEAERGRAEKIADRLVYGYTHHLFPIDITEASEMGLNPVPMAEDVYQSAMAIVKTCRENQVCVEFIDSTGESRPGGAAAGETAAGETAAEGAREQNGEPAAGPVPETAAPAEN